MSFSLSPLKAKSPLDVIHCDVWGPAPILPNKGFRYYVSLTDEFSPFNRIYCCAHKSDVTVTFNQIPHLMSLYTSKNGLADCKHRQILELGLAFVTHASLPFKFWDDICERGNELLSLGAGVSVVIDVNIPIRQPSIVRQPEEAADRTMAKSRSCSHSSRSNQMRTKHTVPNCVDTMPAGKHFLYYSFTLHE